MKSETGVVYHEDYLLHKQPEGHPERPSRLTAVLDYLKETGLIEKLKLIRPNPADLADVLRVHSKEHVRRVEEISASGGGYLDPDTYACPETYRIALLAAGGLVTAADAIMEGEIKDAFALVRPPGHHAEKDRAMGFCYINNLAVCTRHLQNKYDIKKVLIVDWDAHAGNGMTNIFYSDPTVLVISIHQDPTTLYPRTGFIDEIGEGEGRGFTVNIPVPPGTGNREYAYIFDEFISEKTGEFKPDFIITSAGMDSHRDDPLANLNLTEEGYAYMTRKLMDYAKKHCERRLLIELEGGYNLNALAESVHSVIKTLIGEDAPEMQGDANTEVEELVRELRMIHLPH